MPRTRRLPPAARLPGALNLPRGPVAVVLVAAVLFLPLHGQRTSERLRGADRLSESAARERIDHFRMQRLAGDYCFRFELEHIPARGEPAVWTGTLWGSWNRLGPVARVAIDLKRDNEVMQPVRLEMISQNGRTPRAWVRRGRGERFEPLTGEPYFEPLVEGLNYSAFDLQMPFIYWDHHYVGPSFSINRQEFRMIPPEQSDARRNGVAAVELALDEEFNALRRIDVIGEDGDAISTLSVVSFKQVEGQWIVKVIDLLDRSTRDRTRFRVKEAMVGIRIPETTFDPGSTVDGPELPDDRFRKL